MDIKKTANLLINFAVKRLAEIFGFLICCVGTFLLISLLSYSPDDPNFIFPDNTEIKNILGFQGSFISDLFFQSFGLVAYLISFTLIISGINTLRIKDFFFNNLKYFFYYSLRYFKYFIFILFLFECIHIIYKWKWWFYWIFFKYNFFKFFNSNK